MFSASNVSSRKRKFACFAPLAKTAESYIQRLDVAERELAMVKVIQGNEIQDKRLSLPITWKAAAEFKRNSMLTMTDLGDKGNNYAVLFKPQKGNDIFLGYLSGGGIKELFESQSIQAGDKLVLITETVHSIMYVLFRKDAEPHENYATSFATFKVLFDAERTAGVGEGLVLTDDNLQTYWKVILGEGNVSVHGDRYRDRRIKMATDIDVLLIIASSKILFGMDVEPGNWDLDMLEVAADDLRGLAAKGYKVHKTLSLANAMILYKEKHSQLLDDIMKTEEAVKTLRDRYGQEELIA